MDSVVKSLPTGLVDALVNGLFVLALVGLVFPAPLFAQSSWGLGSTAAQRFHIELLEMTDDRTLPASFVLSGGGRELMFELDGGSYRWHDPAQTGIHGREALPDLAEALRWKARWSEDGLLRASLPLESLGSPSPDTTQSQLGSGFDLQETQSLPMAELYGTFDPEARAYAVSVHMPDRHVLDFTISTQSLDLDESSVQKATVIHIPWGILLAIVSRLACAAIHSVCFWACGQVCGEVDYVETAICGVGCTCVCV